MAGVQQVSFTSPYAADEMAIQRRQKLAEMLAKEAIDPLQTNRMAGRFVVPVSPWEGVAKVAKGLGSAYLGNQAEERQKELVKQLQGDASKWVGNQPQGTPAQIQDTTQEGTGSFDMSGTAGPQNVPAQAPSQQAVMGHLMQGLNNPMTAPIAQMKLAQFKSMTDPYTLSEGAQRRGPDGNVIAENPKDFRPEPVKPMFKEVGLPNNMVQEHVSLDGGRTWQPVPGSSPTAKFAKQVAPTIINPPSPTISEVVDPKDQTRMLRVDAKTYKGGSVGDVGVLGVSGKEPTFAKRSEKEDQGKELLKNELDNLRTHFKTLKDKGAVTSDKDGGLSNLQSWARNTSVGQLGGRMFGTEEQSARNEIQSSRLRLLNAIKNATGMSAQQLNSNAELKTWLDSMTSMTGSYESNKGIIDSIEKAFLNPKRRASDEIPDEPPLGAVRPRGG